MPSLEAVSLVIRDLISKGASVRPRSHGNHLFHRFGAPAQGFRIKHRGREVALDPFNDSADFRQLVGMAKGMAKTGAMA